MHAPILVPTQKRTQWLSYQFSLYNPPPPRHLYSLRYNLNIFLNETTHRFISGIFKINKNVQCSSTFCDSLCIIWERRSRSKKMANSKNINERIKVSGTVERDCHISRQAISNVKPNLFRLSVFALRFAASCT